MCEYDALPEVGHGCGHNLIAGIGIAAGEALKSIADELNSEASELINAANIPQTTNPLKPAGNNRATNVGKAASLFTNVKI